MLQQMGVEAYADGDVLVIQGESLASRMLNGRLMKGGAYTSRHDHRMAMAFAPCAIRLGEITIEDPDVVSKSYPTYWSDLEKIGFQLCSIS